MNLTQLIYLKELVHHGSFTRAAQHLGISQPALSAQIKNLEEETELVLIDRNKKPVQLSKDGEAYYEMAAEILQRIEVLKDLPIHLANEVKGVLRLGIIPTLAPYFISLFIEELKLSSWTQMPTPSPPPPNPPPLLLPIFFFIWFKR